MYKLYITALLFVSGNIFSQQTVNYQSVDSISYQNYLIGNWEKLLETGKEAIVQGIDFKNLRKRMGYAYFAKADFYSAQKQFEKAMTFDTSDLDTRAYLYYCGLNLDDKTLAGFHASKLPVETQKKSKIKPFKIIDAVDAEYNYKANDESLGIRSNPSYYRIGVSTKLSNRLNLYQAVSQYSQTVNNSVLTKQTEYFATLNWSISSHTTFDLGYHYISTKVDLLTFPGNLFFAKLSTKINRFHVGVNGSILTNQMDTTNQIGFNAGYTFPGKANIYVNSTISALTNKDSTRLIFCQVIGARIFKPLWVEANVTLGNLKNYNDNNGLYLYNSLDATTFRTGLTLFYNLNRNITLIGNYTYDKKQMENTITKINTNYNQHSFSTGVIWKI